MERFTAHYCPQCRHPLKLPPVSKSLYCPICEMIIKRIDALDDKLEPPQTPPNEAEGA